METLDDENLSKEVSKLKLGTVPKEHILLSPIRKFKTALCPDAPSRPPTPIYLPVKKRPKLFE